MARTSFATCGVAHKFDFLLLLWCNVLCSFFSWLNRLQDEFSQLSLDEGRAAYLSQSLSLANAASQSEEPMEIVTTCPSKDQELKELIKTLGKAAQVIDIVERTGKTKLFLDSLILACTMWLMSKYFYNRNGNNIQVWVCLS